MGVIGWALTGFDADHDERTLYIYDLEVFERFRQRGFGEGLLDELDRAYGDRPDPRSIGR